MDGVRTALLLATAALAGIPATAMAQDRPPEHQGGGHPGGGDHGRGGPAPQNAPHAEASRPAPQTPALQHVQNAQRPQRDQTPPGMQDHRFQNGGGPAGAWRGREGAQAVQAPQAYGGPDDHNRGYHGTQQAQGRPDDHRLDGNRDGYDRGRLGPGAQHGFVPGRPDWRNDRRYDWRGYRDAHREMFRAPRYTPPRGYGYRPFGIGARLAPFFYAQSYWIGDPGYYDLPPVYGPYRWVRYYNDVLLVDLRTGAVVDVIRDFFF